jgi:hypothetical protein
VISICGILGSGADNSEGKKEKKSESGGTELRLRVTFKQLQLLPAGSFTGVTSDTSSAASYTAQAEQQKQHGSTQQQTTGGSNSGSNSKIGSQANTTLEPHHTNLTNTDGASASTTITTTSSSSDEHPAASTGALTSSMKQLTVADANSTAAATVAEPATALASSAAAAAEAIPAAMPAAAAAPVIERRLEAVLLSTAPRLLVVDGFFDAGLCEGLMTLANDKLVRSRVASGEVHLLSLSMISSKPECLVDFVLLYLYLFLNEWQCFQWWAV